jgi:DNA-binding MarR family transcriptional regulator
MARSDDHPQDRGTLLRQVRKEALIKASNRRIVEDFPDADWDLIGLVCEGISYASRPIDRVSQQIGQNFKLGRRGPAILALLTRGLRYPHELASIFQVGRSLISSELAKLIAAGLIISTPGESDRRRTELTLTQKGASVSELFTTGILTDIQQNLQAYSNEDLQLFSTMLNDVRG